MSGRETDETPQYGFDCPNCGDTTVIETENGPKALKKTKSSSVRGAARISYSAATLVVGMNEDAGGAVPHLKKSIEHIERADELLEEDGSGRGYVGEDHMMDALVSLKKLTDARLEVQNAE